MPNNASVCADGTSSGVTTDQQEQQQQTLPGGRSVGTPQSPATRPEDLGVTPWFLEEYPTDTSPGPMGDRSSYPLRLNGSTRNSSIDTEFSKAPPPPPLPRKAYMDLRDAMALLDETCPNVEPSPSLTPRTPRTPLTPYSRNKRARSKSSDNSSNYSNDRLSDRSLEISKEKEKKRPFLRKIGISKTEDRPFLAKLAPRIKGKPYLEKIGPSKAVERPFLDKIGSSKTLDKFIFDVPRIERSDVKNDEMANNVGHEEVQSPRQTWATCERRRSGKEFLLKMYSFETEDLESTTKEPLRGSSLDDVLDSGPSSLPTEKRPEQPAALLKCRVTTSEEIISSTCLDSPVDNSPRRAKKESTTPIRRRILRSCRGDAGDSTPNSPTKRPISSVSPDRESRSGTTERESFSPTKSRKLIVENTGRSINQFERRGISSDNLLAKDALSFVTAARIITDDIGRTREISSEDSLATRRGVEEYSRETFKQLQDKFKLQEIPTESYAAFKRRTRAAQGALSYHERLKMSLLPGGLELDSKNEAAEVKRDQEVRSVLRKQERIDQPNDQEADTNASLRRPKRRIFHEPSQETMDLLTELRKVKSLLKTPSWEKIDLDLDQKPARMPKRILLTDKEFCLSVERENSVRRPSRMINSLETTEEGKVASNHKGGQPCETKTASEHKPPGLALFEKRCLSLDYADEEKPHKPETRAISLASTRNLPSEADDYPDLALICDCKSCSSDVFNSPSEETKQEDTPKERELLQEELPEEGPPEEEPPEDEPLEEDPPKRKPSENHYAEVDIAIPIDQKINISKGEDVQSRTSDLYEIISPRSTPFRVKKRLGKISVEETVKPENFTLGSKVDCRSVVAQKRTKCFPL
ncbi:PREDICTED: uncharacterized protein LOC106747168 [Dinoponera quadriceps]|uniref:Uncharacterized protein LOC106747168 n=1 Tax=Dinoponera quadriceps TaxID=609295 RepID=A0A6P3XNF8_DINQU|nr:PREDICTED: uncharacterized protein LOC106747168 [Dinoponera quadriceps]